MTISDSLPIQFWLNGEDTFNQKSICGIYQACFCQPFECDDEIVIQFTDTVDRNYYLTIVDSDSNELVQLPFTQTTTDSGYTYSLDFTFSQSPEICNKQVQLIISYQENFFTITSEVNDLLETVDGDMTFIDPSLLFYITGDVDDLIETADGDATFIAVYSDTFKYTTSGTPTDACTGSTATYYYTDAVWGTGTIMYTDAFLTTLATTPTYVIKGEDASIYEMLTGAEVGTIASSCA